ncbi:hypothetical protein [Haloarchaeobius iranensis]|uniref:Uncharacterized protein n=1 Tax=Haloarchaeobius iranensis TaxID=996166 RepID=A0A1G9V411_9EURY|nr:hypothetical protein [Haloarchaeobius iranensis]SDM66889.1 hypothetical protein SAMN05192554_105179 [Haloarchaeobius iranensis]
MNRRTVLRLSLIGLPATSGCIGTNESRAVTSIETNSCSEQYIVPDIQIENQTSSARTVHVEIRGESGEETQLLFSNTYQAPADTVTEESERIFKDNGRPFDTYRAEISSGSGEQSMDVSSVAAEPSLHSVRVILSDSGITVRDHHADPGEDYNPNCY